MGLDNLLSSSMASNIFRATSMALMALFLFSCKGKVQEKQAVVIDSPKSMKDTSLASKEKLITDSNAIDTALYTNYYLVVADTSLSYAKLHQQMMSLNRTLKLSIDTLGRYYNKEKDLIALPDNDADELYAGEYYPRRYPSEDLSLEYLNYYTQKAGEKTIALVAGMYAEPKAADSALIALQRVNPKAFKLYSRVYVGCMH